MVQVVYGTSESCFECWTKSFTSVQSANEFVESVCQEITDDGYEYFAQVVTSYAELEVATQRINDLRRDAIADTIFGMEYDDLDEDEQEEVEGYI